MIAISGTGFRLGAWMFSMLLPLLAACGTQPEKLRACSEIPGSIEAAGICLARFECDPGQPKFRGHMCMCWENLCICFVSHSTEPCGAPDDAACETSSSMIIVGPGICTHDAESREAFLGGEYERLLGNGWYDEALAKDR